MVHGAWCMVHGAWGMVHVDYGCRSRDLPGSRVCNIGSHRLHAHSAWSAWYTKYDMYFIILHACMHARMHAQACMQVFERGQGCDGAACPCGTAMGTAVPLTLGTK
jgi:hypothetical protein